MAIFIAFFAVFIIMGFIDIRSMVKTNTQKEIVPYLVLMLISGTTGFFYLLYPYRISIANFIFSILRIKG